MGSKEEEEEEEEEEEVYVHEMCAALVPVSLVLGSHLECLVSQLAAERVLEPTQHKHHPLQQLVEGFFWRCPARLS